MDGDVFSMRLKGADVQIRVFLTRFEDFIYGCIEGAGLSIKRIYKDRRRDGIIISIPLPTEVVDGHLVTIKEIDVERLRHLILGQLAPIYVETKLLVVAQFVDDESDFSIAEVVVQLAASLKASLWIYTYPHGDWTDEEPLQISDAQM